jgi:hypothetical protein
MNSIEWDEGGFRKLTDQIAQDTANELQGVFDRVLEAGRGNSVEQVKVLLAQELGEDTEITDEELTEYAQLLADGTRIEVKAEVER